MPEVGVELGANEGRVCEEIEAASSAEVRIVNLPALRRMWKRSVKL